jgi:ribonuclease J
VSVALALVRVEMAGDPVVEMSGLPGCAADQSMETLVIDAVYDALDSLPKQRRRDADAIEKPFARGARRRQRGVGQKAPLPCHGAAGLGLLH